MPPTQPLRSLLFVPGTQPDRFAKALNTSASSVCIDLEDAVAAQDKAEARHVVLDYLAGSSARVAIRINALTTPEGLADLLAFSETGDRTATILVPKVASPDELRLIDSVLGNSLSALIPIIESCEGLARAYEIATAPRTIALLLGGADLAAELGVGLAWEPLFVARSLVAQAAARAGVLAIDVPHVAIDDPRALAEETARVKALGFTGKAAIHPRQVPIINSCFTPSADEIAEAREAMAEYEAGGERAVAFRGKLLEAPLIRRYRRILSAI